MERQTKPIANTIGINRRIGEWVMGPFRRQPVARRRQHGPGYYAGLPSWLDLRAIPATERDILPRDLFTVSHSQSCPGTGIDLTFRSG